MLNSVLNVNVPVLPVGAFFMIMKSSWTFVCSSSGWAPAWAWLGDRLCVWWQAAASAVSSAAARRWTPINNQWSKVNIIHTERRSFNVNYYLSNIIIYLYITTFFAQHGEYGWFKNKNNLSSIFYITTSRFILALITRRKCIIRINTLQVT